MNNNLIKKLTQDQYPICSQPVESIILLSPLKRPNHLGHNVCNATLPGDGWRTRHDTMKMKLLELSRWAGLPVQCEVFNLFSHLIPQEGLSRLERGRKRQGLVPDFKLQGGDGTDAVLADLKFISGSRSRYPRNPQPEKRAVDRRADGLSAEYARKARGVDREYGRDLQLDPVAAPPVGPVERKLLSFGNIHGYVFGAWGEASEPVHALVQTIASSRLRIAELRPGAREPSRSVSGEMAVLVGSIRRQVSVTAVRSQARLLLDRLDGLVGEGGLAARRRREFALSSERKSLRERSAMAVSLRQNRAILRKGFFKLH